MPVQNRHRFRVISVALVFLIRLRRQVTVTVQRWWLHWQAQWERIIELRAEVVHSFFSPRGCTLEAAPWALLPIFDDIGAVVQAQDRLDSWRPKQLADRRDKFTDNDFHDPWWLGEDHDEYPDSPTVIWGGRDVCVWHETLHEAICYRPYPPGRQGKSYGPGPAASSSSSHWEPHDSHLARDPLDVIGNERERDSASTRSETQSATCGGGVTCHGLHKL